MSVGLTAARFNIAAPHGVAAAGTTIAGVHELEKGGLRATLMNAVMQSTHRADELSKH